MKDRGVIALEHYNLSVNATETYNGELRKRLGRCCCKHCGGELELRTIVAGTDKNGRVEVFCRQCDRIEYGVEKEIYKIAKYYVEEMGFDHYPGLESNIMKQNMNIAKISEIIQWGVQNLGFVSTDGFKYPVDIQAFVIGEELILDDDMINQLRKK